MLSHATVIGSQFQLPVLAAALGTDPDAVLDHLEAAEAAACGHKTKKVHETRRVLVRDVPLGRPTTLVWLQRRSECEQLRQAPHRDHPEIEGKLTRRLACEPRTRWSADPRVDRASSPRVSGRSLAPPW